MIKRFPWTLIFLTAFLGLSYSTAPHSQPTTFSNTARNDSTLLRNVTNSGLQTLLSVNTVGTRRIFVMCTNTVNALAAFSVLVAPNNNLTAPVVIAAAGADYTTPVAPMIRASGALTTLGVATGWFFMDTSGVDNVQVGATSGNAGGSVISCWASTS